MQPRFVYHGHHKCASTWIKKILEEIGERLRLPIEIFNSHMNYWRRGTLRFLQRPYGLICYNSDIFFARRLRCRGFHVIRDPRDIVVSGYFSHRESHPEGMWHRLGYYREYLQSVDQKQGLIAEMSFSAPFLHEMLLWDYGMPLVLELKYEDLVVDPEAGFTRIFEHLGMLGRELPTETLRQVLEKRSFERLSGGRTPGDENVSHHYRKGQAGDWRNHFEPEHIEHFRRLYNPLLLKLGYETDENWS